MSQSLNARIASYVRSRDLPPLLESCIRFDQITLTLPDDECVACFGPLGVQQQAIDTIETLKDIVENLRNPSYEDLVAYDVAIRCEEARLAILRLGAALREFA